MATRFYENLKHALAGGLLWVLFPIGAFAGNLEVTVLDPDGNPVPDVAVYAMFDGAGARATPGSAVMDQKDTRFVPHILVVEVGTSVEFPNSDVVAHHVYSFSKPNNFALPLYKGAPHDPITLRHDGVVTLGCNIHDQMLAYIVVVDTDVHGKTGEDGRLLLEFDDSLGNGSVHIWSPRVRDSGLTQQVNEATSAVTCELKKKLRPAHDSLSEAVQWSEY